MTSPEAADPASRAATATRVLHATTGNMYGGVEAMLATLARHRGLVPGLDQRFALCFEGRGADELRASARCPRSSAGSSSAGRGPSCGRAEVPPGAGQAAARRGDLPRVVGARPARRRGPQGGGAAWSSGSTTWPTAWSGTSAAPSPRPARSAVAGDRVQPVHGGRFVGAVPGARDRGRALPGLAARAARGGVATGPEARGPPRAGHPRGRRGHRHGLPAGGVQGARHAAGRARLAARRAGLAGLGRRRHAEGARPGVPRRPGRVGPGAGDRRPRGVPGAEVRRAQAAGGGRYSLPAQHGPRAVRDRVRRGHAGGPAGRGHAAGRTGRDHHRGGRRPGPARRPGRAGRRPGRPDRRPRAEGSARGRRAGSRRRPVRPGRADRPPPRPDRPGRAGVPPGRPRAGTSSRASTRPARGASPTTRGSSPSAWPRRAARSTSGPRRPTTPRPRPTRA